MRFDKPEVNGTLLGVGASALAKEVKVLQLVAVEVTRDEDALTSHKNNLVSCTITEPA